MPKLAKKQTNIQWGTCAHDSETFYVGERTTRGNLFKLCECVGAATAEYIARALARYNDKDFAGSVPRVDGGDK